MSWPKYGEFLAFAALLVLIPGPDFAVVTKNALAGGRRQGSWTSAGVATSNFVQGTAAASGLRRLRGLDRQKVVDASSAGDADVGEQGHHL